MITVTPPSPAAIVGACTSCANRSPVRVVRMERPGGNASEFRLCGRCARDLTRAFGDGPKSHGEARPASVDAFIGVLREMASERARNGNPGQGYTPERRRALVRWLEAHMSALVKEVEEAIR